MIPCACEHARELVRARACVCVCIPGHYVASGGCCTGDASATERRGAGQMLLNQSV